MPKFVPSSYGGVSLQQFMPLVQRRSRFTPQEDQEINQGSSQWLPRIFTSWADSPAVDMMSPGRAALMAAAAGGSAVGLGMNALGAQQDHSIAGGAAGAGISGLLGYFAAKARNDGILETMRRIPANGTRRDMLSDPVLQAEMERDSRNSTTDESLRTAQLLAVLQATKHAGVKQAGGWSAFGKLWQGIKANRRPITVGTLGAAGWDAALNHDQYTDLNTVPTRALLGLVNATMLGRGIKPGGNLSEAITQIPTKDLAVTAAVNMVPAVTAAARRYASAPAAITAAPSANVTAPPASSSFNDAVNWVDNNKWKAGGGLAALLAMVGGGGLLARDAIHSLADSSQRVSPDAGGRIRVTLPTRRPGDAETQIDMPVQQIPISNALFGRVRRDAVRRLQDESKQRTHKRTLSPEEKRRRAQSLAMALGRPPPTIDV